MKFVKKHVDGFTLPELMVVLVIVGILVLLALPSLLPLITKAKSLEAQQSLRMVHQLERSHYYQYSRFSDDLDRIGFEYGGKFITEGGNVNYQVEIVESGPTNFLAKATALADWDNDGQFNTWTIDHEGDLRETIRD
ncbi:MAG TPA: general secretion pathway protein GspG [Cytophagales bacterium]|nr:general secretion pathway protein GspG [Cytophagales bacterium]HAA19039.1 general secretion pathway protein GspG [Cytophagales bacterium]HAP64550.1 general secretion pathway protein GspG [Cytophagales bacterium]